MVNKPFLKKVLAKLKANPKGFDMWSWEGKSTPCGTTHCVAGALLTEAGFRFTKTPRYAGDVEFYTPWGTVEYGGDAVVQWGAKILGIETSQAQQIFHPSDWPDELAQKLDRNNEAVKSLQADYRKASTKAKKKEIFAKILAKRRSGLNLTLKQIRDVLGPI